MQFSTQTSGLLVRPEPHRRTAFGSPLQWLVRHAFGTSGLSTTAIFTALSVALFVNLIILIVDTAAVWSLAGYLHLPGPVVMALAAALYLPSAWLCWKVAKLSLEAERDADLG